MTHPRGIQYIDLRRYTCANVYPANFTDPTGRSDTVTLIHPDDAQLDDFSFSIGGHMSVDPGQIDGYSMSSTTVVRTSDSNIVGWISTAYNETWGNGSSTWVPREMSETSDVRARGGDAGRIAPVMAGGWWFNLWNNWGGVKGGPRPGARFPKWMN